ALCPPRAFEALPPDFALLALPLPLEAALLILDAAPAPPAPSNITLIWLGIARIPNALKRFCTARLVKRVAGMHLNNTLGTQVMCREGPMTDGDIKPNAKPGLSPLVMGIVVNR